MLLYSSQQYIRGSKKNSVVLELRDATTGAAVTGKVAADMTISVGKWRQNLDIVTPVNLANALAIWLSSGFIQLSLARLPGLYRFDIPDNAFINDGISDVLIIAALCTGCTPFYIMLPLTDIDDSQTSRTRL